MLAYRGRFQRRTSRWVLAIGTLVSLIFIPRLLVNDDGAVPAIAIPVVPHVRSVASLQKASRTPPAKKPMLLAPPAATIPKPCYDDQGFKVLRDTECYMQSARETLIERAADPHARMCWGHSAGNTTLLFHTAAITAIPDQVVLLISSFLATQCCDAVLHFWLPEALLSQADKFPVAPQHAGRVVWRLLDVTKEWDSVKDDFPGHNATAVAAMTSFSDLRYISDWVRLVLMYKYGGFWVDIDTVLLADMRPLFSFQTMIYRAGQSILPNNAVFKLAQRPDELARVVIERVIQRADPRPQAVGYVLEKRDVMFGERLVGYKKLGAQWISETLFDFLWYRFMGELWMRDRSKRYVSLGCRVSAVRAACHSLPAIFVRR